MPQNRTVHPHERGERPWRNHRRRYRGGSSPRAWGTDDWHDQYERRDRFIPTSVGNGYALRRRIHCTTVHPHERGERSFSRYAWPIFPGSSPRAWGTALHPVLPDTIYRFIPTSVGNGRTGTLYYAGHAVHPHERGERSGSRALTRSRYGSSPRAWGTVFHWKEYHVWDGSSPRAWGTGRGRKRNGARSRFIPTSVGNGGNRHQKVRRLSVHPHERGERRMTRVWSASNIGSSPRAWGTAY